MIYWFFLFALIIAIAVFLQIQRRSGSQLEQPPEPQQEVITQESQQLHASRGIKAFMNGRYDEAFELLEPAAKQGHLKSQLILAKMYYAGNGVEANKDQYIHWLEQAAQNGDKSAKIKLKKIQRNSDD